MTKRTHWIAGLLLFGASVSLLAKPGMAQQVPMPAIESTPSFAAQVAGRTALIDSYIALTQIPRLSITIQRGAWNNNGPLPPSTGSYTETFLLDRDTRRMRLEYLDGNWISDGKDLVRTHHRDWYYRLALQGHQRELSNAVEYMGGDKERFNMVARIALWGDNFPVTQGLESAVSVEETIYRANDGSVIVVLPVTGVLFVDAASSFIVYRYRFDESHLPISFESWSTYTFSDAARPRADNYYGTEKYTYAPYPESGGDFAADVSHVSREVPPPSPSAATVESGPDQADQKAMELLTRWYRAWARFTAYQANLHVREWQQAKIEGGVAANEYRTREADMQVYYQRPGRLYAFTKPTESKTNHFGTYQTLVSDGTKYAVYYGKNHEEKRGERATGEEMTIGPRARAIGFYNFGEGLPRVMDRPQQLWRVAADVKYRGKLPLPGGGSAEAVTITQLFNGDPIWHTGDSGVPNRQQTLTVYFNAKTGMPVRYEFKHEYLPVDGGRSISELPPDEYRTTDFRDVTLDKEPPRGIFDLSGQGKAK